MKPRVVVTGMGVVSPVGNTLADFWRALCEGRSGITLVDRFDTEGFPSRIAGLVRHCAPAGLTNKDLYRMDRFSVYAVDAASQAWAQAGIDVGRTNPRRCGVVLGSGIGGIETFEEQAVRLHEGGAKRVSPLFVPKALANMASANIAIRLGLTGPNKAVLTACAAAAHCIADAVSLIRAGRADVVLAGGAEASVTPLAMAAFGAMKALSCRNEAPEKASRPFDRDRDGFVVSEGAGVLVCESEAHAKARGAVILGEIAGTGESCDAYHITTPRPDGAGAVAAMSSAIEDAECETSAVDYVNAHGTSTVYNDAAEALALRLLFGDAVPPVSSTKSMTGHLLGAAGAVEAVACIMAIRHNTLPPSINYESPDPECNIPIVANEAREADVAIALSNSLGFGGHNASIVFRRYAG